MAVGRCRRMKGEDDMEVIGSICGEGEGGWSGGQSLVREREEWKVMTKWICTEGKKRLERKWCQWRSSYKNSRPLYASSQFSFFFPCSFLTIINPKVNFERKQRRRNTVSFVPAGTELRKFCFKFIGLKKKKNKQKARRARYVWSTCCMCARMDVHTGSITCRVDWIKQKSL